MRGLSLAVFLALSPLSALAQSVESEPRQRDFFSWFTGLFAPPREESTAVAIDAGAILRRDNAREEFKEKTLRQKERERDEAIIGQRARAVAESKLKMARERGKALAGLESSRPSRGLPGAEAGAPQESADSGMPPAIEPPKAAGALQQFKNDVTRRVDSTSRTLDQATREIAEVVEREIFGTPAGTSPKWSSMLLALLAIFLVPSAAVILLALAFLSVRGGHRLQAAVLGGTACALLVLVYAAARQPPDQSARLAALRAECEKSAVTLSGYVEEATAEGVVVDDVRGAASDEHGSVLVVTAKKNLRGGERWRLVAYPVGTRRAPNTLGLMQPMPAYAESIDLAVSILAEAERARSEWWWQRLARSAREALGSDPQRLITLK